MPPTIEFYDPPGGLSGRLNEDFQSTYTRTIKAEASDVVGPVRVANELYAQKGCRIGSPYTYGVQGTDAWYEEDLLALVTGIRFEPSSEDGRQWTVTVEYGPRPERASNPMDEVPELQWDRTQFEEPVDLDIDGVAIQNSAGDQYDPPVMRDQSRPTLIVTRNEAWPFPETLANQYRDTVNMATFFGGPPRTVKCASIKAVRDWHQACGFYAKVVYEFHGNRDGWRPKVRDQGFRELVSGARKQITIDGQPATSAVPLNGAGVKLAGGGTPIYREHKVYPEMDFTALNIPGA